jgi:cation-transporting ATPase 13A1
MPTFGELFQEHAIAPFFVFQIFCVMLWCLDEYWYYSIFTLIMLVVFESTVVMQRQKSLDMLRNMRRPAYPLLAFRNGRWCELLSDDLVPGDLISLACSKSSSAEDIVCPCDAVLLQVWHTKEGRKEGN